MNTAPQHPALLPCSSSPARKTSTLKRRLTACLWLPVAAFLSVPAVGAADANEPPPGTVLAQYVLLAFSDVEQATVPLARVVVQGARSQCPQLKVKNGNALSMQVRPNPDTSAFNVQVCEALVPAGGVVTVAGQGQPLPVPEQMPLTVNKLVAFGDSGCKGGKSQPCDDFQAWPFPVLTAAAVHDQPDVVVHLGDYNYRGTPSKTADDQWAYDGCLSAGSEPTVTQRTRDTWTTWQEDFFAPAHQLLQTAPWVVVRGNHELCSRAGQGWFYLLDPHSTLLSPYTELPGCHAPTMQTQPYRLSLANVDFVVLDSTNACGGEAPEKNHAVEFETFSFQQQFNTVNALVNEGTQNPAWLLSHRPLWGISLFDPSEGAEVITDTLQNGLAQSFAGALDSDFSLVLSGHMHEFQAVTFAGDRQPQLVIGHSGVKLSDDLLAPGFRSMKIDGMDAHGIVNTTQHGYLRVAMENGGQWQGVVFGQLHADSDHTDSAQRGSGGQPVQEQGLVAIAICEQPVKGALCVAPTEAKGAD